MLQTQNNSSYREASCSTIWFTSRGNSLPTPTPRIPLSTPNLSPTCGHTPPFFLFTPSSTYGLAIMLLFTICNAGLYFTVHVCHSRVVWTWFLQHLLWDSGLKIVTKFGFYTLYFLMEIKITALMNEIIYPFIFIALKCSIWISYAFLTGPFLIP